MMMNKLMAGLVMVWAASNYTKIANNTVKTVKGSVAVVELKRIDDALQNYAAMQVSSGEKEFTYPAVEDFEQFMDDSFETPGRNELLDQWGHKFGYERLKDGYRLTSAGPDGQMGTEDDLWLERVKEKVKMSTTLHDVEKTLTKAIQEEKERLDEVVKTVEKVAQESGVELPKIGATESAAAKPASSTPPPEPSTPPAPSAGAAPAGAVAPATSTATRATPAATVTPPVQPAAAKRELSAAERREVSTLLSLGKTYMANKKSSQATQHFRKVLDKFPDSSEAASAREYLEQLK